MLNGKVIMIHLIFGLIKKHKRMNIFLNRNL